MPTTQDGKKTGSAARAESAEDNSYVSKDSFVNPALQTLKNTATAEDGMGVERIVLPASTAYTMAPTSATKEQKARMEALQGSLDEAKGERLAQLKSTHDVKEEDRVDNEPYNAGSQSGPTSDKDEQPKTTETTAAAKGADKKDEAKKP